MKKTLLLLLLLHPLVAFTQAGQFLQSRQLSAEMEIDLIENRLDQLNIRSDLIDSVTLKNGEIILDYHLPDKSPMLRGVSFYRLSLSIRQEGRPIPINPEYLLGTNKVITNNAETQVILSHLLPTFIDMKSHLELILTMEEWVDCGRLQAQLNRNKEVSKWHKAGFIAGGALILGGGTLVLISNSTYNRYLDGESAEAVEDEFRRSNDLLDGGVIMLIAGATLITADIISLLIRKGNLREIRNGVLEVCPPGNAVSMRPMLKLPKPGFPSGGIGLKLTYTFPSDSL